MKIEKSFISGVYKIQNNFLEDDRGSFSRLFCNNELGSIMLGRSILQINRSVTVHVGSIRGMHYQNQPKAEMKIVRCSKGAVFDVVVDLRRKSNTFLRWDAIELRPESNNSIIIPEGCAHGFQALISDSEMLYLHTQYYDPQLEGGVLYSDPIVGIDWPLKVTNISKKDSMYPLLTSNFTGIEI